MTTPHLDDEALSAALDGEATADETAHVAGCARCAERLAQLQDASAAIGEVPPPEEGARDAAIAGALEAASPVVALASRRAGPPRWLLAAAAVVVAAGIGVPVVASLRDRGHPTAAKSASRAELSGSGLVDGGDLGDLDARSDLRARVQGALRGQPVPAPSAAAGGAAGDAGGAIGGAATAAAPAAPTAPPPDPTRCDRVPPAGDPQLAALRYRATARFDGKPAAVLAYAVPSASRLTVRVYVVALDTCTIVSQQSFAA